jgi:hypothetical protein
MKSRSCGVEVISLDPLNSALNTTSEPMSADCSYSKSLRVPIQQYRIINLRERMLRDEMRTYDLEELRLSGTESEAHDAQLVKNPIRSLHYYLPICPMKGYCSPDFEAKCSLRSGNDMTTASQPSTSDTTRCFSFRSSSSAHRKKDWSVILHGNFNK